MDVSDLFPSIIDIAVAQPPTAVQIDGQSLLGYIDPTWPTPIPREFQFDELIDGAIDQWAISDGTTKFMFATVSANNNTGGITT